MTRRLDTWVCLGCAVVLLLEGPRAWSLVHDGLFGEPAVGLEAPARVTEVAPELPDDGSAGAPEASWEVAAIR